MTRIRVRPRGWAALLALLVSLCAARAQGHSVDTSTLKLTEVAAGEFTIAWQTTASTLKELGEPARYPRSCRRQGAVLDCGPLGLAGTIAFPWLEGSESRVTVLVDWLSGARLLRVVSGRSPSLTVYGVPASAGWRFLEPIAIDYTRFGVEHILTGFDHLMFVLAITILVRRRRALIGAITAFTIAHSLTLAATVLGWLVAVGGRRDDDRSLDRPRLRRVPAPLRFAGPSGALAGHFRVRPTSRHGLRLGAARDGPARDARSVGAVVLQRRRGARVSSRPSWCSWRWARS